MGDTAFPWYPCKPESVIFAYSVLAGVAAGIDEKDPNLEMLEPHLFRPAPNPMNGEIKITYRLPEPCRVMISIHSIGGRMVKTLINRLAEVGSHETTWEGRNSVGTKVAPGVYLCRMVTRDRTQTRKLVLIQ
jgi:hypothetical protein